jgi:hypothetical protein
MPSVRRTKNGTRVVRAANDNSIPEWKIQAEAVRRLKAFPGYGDEVGPGVTFTLAGDFNAARRSMQESVKAKATGIAAGEEDLRIYGLGGRLLLIEMKGPKTQVSADQRKRHALHRDLGFRVEIIRGKSIDQGASEVVDLVKEWLAEAFVAAA